MDGLSWENHFVKGGLSWLKLEERSFVQNEQRQSRKEKGDQGSRWIKRAQEECEDKAEKLRQGH